MYSDTMEMDVDGLYFDDDEIPFDPSEVKLKALRRQTFFLWMFVANEGLWDDAHEFIYEGINRSGSIDYGI